MAVSTYLQRPIQWSCAQWNGSNSADITAVLTAVGWSWSVVNGVGTAQTPFGSSIPVQTGTWVMSGNGAAQFLDAAQFAARFVAGSSWSVAP